MVEYTMQTRTTMTLSPEIPKEDIAALVRDKYQGDASAVTEEDRARLSSGEPLAYVIGWQPFLGLEIHLDSKPLIPRPETEWWTEKLIVSLKERYGDSPFSFLDLCAGSGAIGLGVAKHCTSARVTCAELVPEHARTIEQNAVANGIPASQVRVVTSDLFDALAGERFDCIAINPPYIPLERTLPESVRAYEPHEALFSETDGLGLIRAIAQEVPEHLNAGAQVWVEADITNVQVTASMMREHGARQATVMNDQYDRPRLVVAYW